MALFTAIEYVLNTPGVPADARGMRGRRGIKRAVAAVLLLGATIAVFAVEWLAFLWPVAAFPVVFAGIRSSRRAR